MPVLATCHPRRLHCLVLLSQHVVGKATAASGAGCRGILLLWLQARAKTLRTSAVRCSAQHTVNKAAAACEAGCRGILATRLRRCSMQEAGKPAFESTIGKAPMHCSRCQSKAVGGVGLRQWCQRFPLTGRRHRPVGKCYSAAWPEPTQAALYFTVQVTAHRVEALVPAPQVGADTCRQAGRWATASVQLTKPTGVGAGASSGAWSNRLSSTGRATFLMPRPPALCTGRRPDTSRGLAGGLETGLTPAEGDWTGSLLNPLATQNMTKRCRRLARWPACLVCRDKEEGFRWLDWQIVGEAEWLWVGQDSDWHGMSVAEVWLPQWRPCLHTDSRLACVCA